MRTAGAATVGTDGIKAEILDANGNVIFTQTVLPGTTFTNYNFNFSFPSAGTYTLRLTEVGNDDSLGAVIDDVQITGTSTAVDASGDTLDGGDGSDTLFGYAGNDSLVGGAGIDSLVGGEGDDTLSGGADNDIVSGGNGNDRIIGSANDAIDGGAGTDTLDNTAGTTAEVVTFTSGTGGTVSDGSTFTGVEVFASDVGADRYDAANATIALTISTGADNDTVTGGSANDTIDGGSGADSLSGGGGADSILGGAGADTILGGAGNDLLDGGDDADRFVIAAGDGTDQVTGGEGGTDSDTLDLSGLTTGVTATLTGEAGTASTSGVTVNFTQIERLQTGTGADTISAATATTGVWIDAGAGDNRITGSGLADTITAAGGADSITSGAGADLVDAGGGDDTLTGEAGNDTLTGGDGQDQLYGGSDADRLYGGAGNDLLSGGEGDDSLEGGTGNDSFAYAAGEGQDTVTGGEDGLGGDIDTLSYSSSAPATVIFSGNEAGTLSLADGGSVSFTQIEAIQTQGGNDLIDARASGSAQTLGSGGGDDTVWGGGGSDQILAGTGSDWIDGGAGADSITGGSGSDTFIGGIGDTVDGGAGDNDLLDLSDWGWARTNVIYNPTDPQAGTVQFLDTLGNVVGSMAFSNIEKVMPCFTPGTLIETARGPLAVEALVPGDLVLTRDNGPQRLRWVGKRALSLADLIVQPRLRPLRIAAGSLGQGLPLRDLVVSPQHRMLIEGARAEMLFGEPEVLVAARHLGAEDLLPQGVTYIHLLFDAHEIIRAEGAWTESFQPAARMLSEMEAETRAEIEALFPELHHEGFPAARLSLKAHEARVLLEA